MPSNKVPMTQKLVFDVDVLAANTPILYRVKGNTHPFQALVREVTEDQIVVFNGFVESAFDIGEVEDGEVIIYPMFDKGARTEYLAEVFDDKAIPLTSILLVSGSDPLVVVEVSHFSLVCKHSSGSERIILPSEIDHTTDTIIYPPETLDG